MIMPLWCSVNNVVQCVRIYDHCGEFKNWNQILYKGRYQFFEIISRKFNVMLPMVYMGKQLVYYTKKKFLN